MNRIKKSDLQIFVHELNNLLVGIEGYTHLLQKERSLSPQGVNYLQKLQGLVDTTTELSFEFQEMVGIPHQRSKESSSGNKKSKGYRILVIDDDPDVRNIVSRSLQSEGFTVTTATDGQKGLELFSEHPFDCVLLDLSMPLMSGNLVFARIKAISPSTPVIIMSAFITDERMSTFSQITSTCFIQKPFETKDLVEIVIHACTAETRIAQVG